MNTNTQLRRPPTGPNRPRTAPGDRAVAGSGHPRQQSLPARYAGAMLNTPPPRPALLRSELGDVLRSLRTLQGRTLREVSSQAQVSLGYLSEVERGQKEASSELLESISSALGVPLWFVLREVADRMMSVDSSIVPDTIPDDLLSGSLAGQR